MVLMQLSTALSYVGIALYIRIVIGGDHLGTVILHSKEPRIMLIVFGGHSSLHGLMFVHGVLLRIEISTCEVYVTTGCFLKIGSGLEGHS
jgi:hypothetical protein